MKKDRRTSLAGKPSQQILNTLLKHFQAGQFGQAEMLSISLTQEFPTHPFGWKVLGAVLRKKGEYDGAMTANEEAVRLSPNDAEAHNNLANTLKELGRLDDAETEYKQAIELRPQYAEAHNNLGIVLTAIARLDEAESSYFRAIAFKPNYAEAHNNLGVTLKELGRLQEAEESFRRAIELNPDYAEAHNNLGVTLKELGCLDDAEGSYKQAIALKPDFAEAHRNLTLIKKCDSREGHLLEMQTLYRDKSISEDQRCHICFALAKASEDLADFAAAFQYYREGNALRKKFLTYDRARDVTLFKKLKFNYHKIAAHSLRPKNLTSDLIPIFVVGMPRSGTTLVEQIISSHSQVTGAGELPFALEFGGQLAENSSLVDSRNLEIFRDQYLGKLKKYSEGRPIVTDKMPHNFQYVGLLAAAFPEAKIVHVKREAAALCWANYEQYFPSSELRYCYDLDDIIEYYGMYQDLMDFWKETLSGKVYDLEYELLTVNQEEETRKLINYLALSWQRECLSPHENKRSVSTGSSIQVRRRIYQGSSNKWKRYKPYLNGVLDKFSTYSN